MKPLRYILNEQALRVRSSIVQREEPKRKMGPTSQPCGPTLTTSSEMRSLFHDPDFHFDLNLRVKPDRNIVNAQSPNRLVELYRATIDLETLFVQ